MHLALIHNSLKVNRINWFLFLKTVLSLCFFLAIHTSILSISTDSIFIHRLNIRHAWVNSNAPRKQISHLRPKILRSMNFSLNLKFLRFRLKFTLTFSNSNNFYWSLKTIWFVFTMNGVLFVLKSDDFTANDWFKFKYYDVSGYLNW